MFCNKCEHGVNRINRAEVATVRKCLELLSEEERIVVLTYYYDNLTIKEIAEVFETSEDTVRCRLYLVRRHLMTILGEENKKQEYKLPASENTMLILALDDIMNSKVELTESELSAQLAATFRKSG